jgi:hypothetical protein
VKEIRDQKLAGWAILSSNTKRESDDTITAREQEGTTEKIDKQYTKPTGNITR